MFPEADDLNSATHSTRLHTLQLFYGSGNSLALIAPLDFAPTKSSCLPLIYLRTNLVPVDLEHSFMMDPARLSMGDYEAVPTIKRAFPLSPFTITTHDLYYPALCTRLHDTTRRGLWVSMMEQRAWNIRFLDQSPPCG